MTLIDWMVIGAYAAIVLMIGLATKRGSRDAEDLFLGGRSIPAWAACLSMIATELSAATFIAVPASSFNGGTWFYIQFAIGSLLARFVLAAFFLPAYYRARLVTVYGLLRTRFGELEQRIGAFFFLGGRLIASGSRLYIAGFAFAVATGLSMQAAIVIAGVIGLVYTAAGGIRAVIWTDTLQGAVFIVAAIGSVIMLGLGLPGGFGALFEAAGSVDKINLPEPLLAGTSATEALEVMAALWEGFRTNYLEVGNTLNIAIFGGLFLTLATHGTDQDMVQRLLTTKKASKGGAALIVSGFANFPLVATFLTIGTGMALWFAAGGPGEGFKLAADESGQIFPIFVLEAMPVGLRGLVFAGLFAAAMSSMDSALNALATTWVVDIRRKADTPQMARETKLATVSFGALLIGMALFMTAYADRSLRGEFQLIDLALGALTAFYGALLGVFALALFTKTRGSRATVCAAFAVGAVIGLVGFLQPFWVPLDAKGKPDYIWTWPWTIPFASIATFAVGALGARRVGKGGES